MKNLFRHSLLMLLLISTMNVKAQVPLYNSSPSSSAVIFLDFDGHTVNGTSWNYSGPIECGGAGLTTAKITEIFNRVAEDYRPFNINITTDSTKFLAAAANRRMRVILTVTSSWYGNSGGVAFVNSFTSNDNTPCFVFTALLGYSAKNIAEAASHEAGHTLGLYHQSLYDANCVKITDYYAGTGSGETSWAPIMGVGYYRNVTTWYNGPNSYGCNSLQSDLDIIVSRNGFSYKSDDMPATFNQATSVGFVNNQLQAQGMIETSTDADMFKMVVPNTTATHLVMDVLPYSVGSSVGSNIDLKVTLYNNSQTVLNTYNPPDLLSVKIDTILTPGTYYMKMESVGNQYTPAYASLGEYILQGQLSTSGTLPLHKLELNGTLVGDNHKLNWEIIADEQITDLKVEMSTDGITFSELTQTTNDTRSYTYKPSVNTTVQYRLNVTFDDGRQYYSNVVSLRSKGSTTKPQVLGNIITGNSISVLSPGKFSYAILDMSGKTLNKGQLTSGSNTINTTGMISGMYLIRFADNEQQWTDKLIHQ
ncbi:MAG TPA: T9SS type A sorting domain-containing protein [Chitinophagaceae bacterium]